MLSSQNVSTRIHARHAVRRRAGFTMVELLVVIGIIIILMSILLPVVSAVRESSRSTKCQSNQQQIHKVFLTKQVHLGTRLRPENLVNYFADELGDTPEVYICPNATPSETTAALDTQWSTMLTTNVVPPSSFGFNPRMARLNGTDDAHKIFSLDYKAINVDVLGPQAPVEQFIQNVAARHRGECNVLFFDGHVESRDPTVAPSDNLSIDPSHCWVHEDHWRPNSDFHLRRTVGDCATRSEGSAVRPTDDTGDPNNPTPPEPGPCEIPAPVVMDDDAAIVRGADWQSGDMGFGGSHQVSPAGGENVNAQWTIPQLDHSIYQVMVTWEALATNTQQATFQVYDGGTTDNLLEEFQVNMQEEPETDLWVGGRRFQDLSDQLEIRNGALTVLLIGSGGGNLCADAVRVSCPGDDSDSVPGSDDGNGPPPEPPGPDLLLNYKFDSGEQPGLDSSEEGNHGWLVSATHMQCQSGGAVALSGDNGFGSGYVEAPTFEMGGAITVSAWVNYNSFDQAGTVFNFGSGGNEIVLGNFLNLGTAYFRVGGQQVALPNCFEIGTWIHVTASVSASGTLKITKTGGDNPGSETADGSVAQTMTRSQHNIGEGIDGLIDDVRVYDIETEPNPGQPPSNCSIDLTIHYTFDNESNPYKNDDPDSGVGYDADPSGNPAVRCSDDNSGYLELNGSSYLSFGQTGLVGDQSITVMALVKMLGPVIVDDSGQEFSTNGGAWTTANANGGQEPYEGSHHVLPAGGSYFGATAGQSSTFTVNVDPGSYKLFAYWPSDATEQSARFQLADGSGNPISEAGGGQIPITTVDQRNPSNNLNGDPNVPDEFQQIAPNPNGGGFLDLSGGQVQVTIDRLAFFGTPGVLSADAILLLPNIPAGSQAGGPIFGSGSGTRQFSVGTYSDTDTGDVMAYIQVGPTAVEAPVSNLTGRWAHLCGVYDASAGEARVYVDGQLVASGAATANLSDTGFPTVASAGGANFYGKLDEFWLFSRALDGGEISNRAGQANCQD